VNHQVHGFCDVLDNGFAAVIYLRTGHKTDEVRRSQPRGI